MTNSDGLGTVIVTGASRGIGAAVARLAAERGHGVAVNFATGTDDAAEVVRQIISGGGRAVAIQADVSREEDVMRLFVTAERELGPISALVNNAAITGGFARVDSVSAKVLTEVMAVNVCGSDIVRAGGGAADVHAARRERWGDCEYFISRRAHGFGGRVGALRGVEGRD